MKTAQKNLLSKVRDRFLGGFLTLAVALSPIAPLFMANTASAASTGAQSGTTFAGNVAISSGDHDWTNPSFAQNSDDNRATVQITNPSNISNYLRATGFGFAIPAGSTINGITVGIERSEASQTSSSIRDNVVSLVKNNVVTGSNKAAISTNWPTSDGTANYGGTSDLWGTSWTVADINNANFGVVLSVGRNGGTNNNETARVDQMTIAVDYTLPIVPAELVVTKANNVSGNITVGNTFQWTLTVNNLGAGPATFNNNQDILQDDLPTNANYSPTSNIAVTTGGGVTGTVDCDVSSNTLDCDADGTVVMPANGWFSVTLSVTPDGVSTLANPRSGGICRVDPDTLITESNENNNDCSDTVNVNAVTNPSLSQACGLDIALVIDNSTSIDSGEMTQMKNALTGFVNALNGTPTEFSVTRFASNATVVQPFTSNAATVNSAINGVPTGGGFTNWEDGLDKAATTLPNRTNPNLVVFATDGDPTASSAGADDTNQPNIHLAPAVAKANALKNGGTHILALGIGLGGGSIDRLKAISGPNADTGNVLTSDVITSNFANLATDLATFAQQTCGGTVTVKKVIDADGDPNTTNDRTPASNWSFNIGGQANKVTDANGFTPAVTLTAGSGYSVTETAKPGYALMSASCTGAANNGSLSSNSVTGITINNTNIVTCTFVNKAVGTITLIKSVTNNNGGSAGVNDFGLTIGGTAVTSGQTLNVNAGSYAINEAGKNGYQFVSITGTGCPAQLGSNVTVAAGQNITCTITNDDIAPQLTVIKSVVNNNGGTKVASDFTMNVTGANVSLPSFPGSTSGTTVTLNVGSYDADETAATGYAKSLGANCSGTIALGEHKTCTITNDDVAPILTLLKYVINDNGGLLQIADFPLFIDGSQVTSGLPNVLNAGTHTATETNKPGYTAGDWGGDCTANGTITLVVGDVKSCTITNYDQPGTLIVKKVVVNDNGGTKEADDFSFSVNGGSTLSFEADGQNEYTVNAGTYSIVETAAAGYTATYENCSNVEVANGETETCTITNNDQPGTLIVKKVVINDNGGTKNADDFSFSVNGGSATTFEADGRNDLTVNAGAYDVTEPAYSGYATSYDSCEDVVVPNGGTATCTITNNDIAAQLTVIKHVVNNNGGTKNADDFTMNVTGTNVSDASFPGDENGTTITLNAGSYSVDEDAVYGYAKTLGANCSGTIALGEHKTCTITNDDIQPKLTVTKVVMNDNGGTKQVSDFPLFVNVTSVTSGAQNGFNAGAYTISETQATGYSASISGDCDASGNVTLNVGDVKTCTITNNDIAPKLTLVKYVTNNNGGNAVVADFPLFVNGNLVTSSTKNTLTANVLYTTTETNLPGYTAGDWGGDCTANGTITLLPGDDKTCTITNDDVAPTLTLIKSVIKDNGGTTDANDFGLSIGGTSVNSGETKTVNANTPIVINEVGLTGYQFVSITGDAKCPAVLGGTITLNEGENITCTITNDDISPTLKLIKHVINNNGGLLSVSDFMLYVGATNVTSNVSNLFNAGAYLVNELNKPGYTASSWSGDCDASGNITLQLGQDYTCEITNDDQPAKIKVTKVVVNNNGGTAEADDFTLKVNNTTVVSGETNEFDGNTSYTIGEGDMPYGYVQTGLTCIDTTVEAAVANPFVAELGHNYECTVTNDDVAPKLTITKKTLPAESKQAFKFTSEQLEGFSLADGESVTFDGLQAGTYDVTEEATAGWRLINVTCEGGEYATEGNSLLVGLSIGNDVTCEFTNEQLNTIQGHKFNDINGNHEWDENEPALAGWTITLTKECVVEEEVILFLQSVLEDDYPVEECEPTKTSTVTDATGAYSFESLEPGTYTVCEVQKAIWTQTYPQTGDGCHEITIEGPGEVITADFGNKAKPQVLDEHTSELVNTGTAAAISTTLGLVILSILGALHLSTRRKNYQD